MCLVQGSPGDWTWYSPQRRQHTDFRGAEGGDREAAAGPQQRGRGELRTLGRMLISGLGVGDAWARGLPEEVTSGG